jgi:hypothetical protein
MYLREIAEILGGEFNTKGYNITNKIAGACGVYC